MSRHKHSAAQHKTILQSLPLRMISTRLLPVILALLSVTLLIFHKVDTLPVDRLQMAVTDVMAPALEAISKPFSSMVDGIDGITTIRTLKAENIRLAEENEKLKQWYEQALRLQAENQSYRELLNVRADPAMAFVTTRVVSDPGGSFVKSVLLPVGQRDNVQKGSAVMSGNGLIGRVTESGVRSSRVLLITDINSRLPVVIQNTRTRAILAGKNNDLLQLERLSVDSGVSVGQRVVTSGGGGLLPADIPVGIIVKADEGGVFVRPLADVDRARHVQVINYGSDEGLVTGNLSPDPAAQIQE